MAALKIRLTATVVVAMSSSQGPGTAMQIGLVPTRGCFPCHGGTIGECGADHDADLSYRRHFLCPPGCGAEVIGFAGRDGARGRGDGPGEWRGRSRSPR